MSRAKRHQEVAEFLADSEHYDWAAVALFYSAHQWVHSSLADEPDLVRDERHPRKHTMPSGKDGRGTTQLVAALYPSIEVSYRSLFDLSWRTRYDFKHLAIGMGRSSTVEADHESVQRRARVLQELERDATEDLHPGALARAFEAQLHEMAL